MEIEPRMMVTRATDHLASRLEDRIQEVLAPHLGGLPWTQVLVELDAAKGRQAREVAAIDLQSQLRIITERLGTLGFPFDDEYRTVSTLGSELRAVRRNLAHTHAFDWLEAWRASDHCVRLLEALGDADGLVDATRIRHEIFEIYAREQGTAPVPPRVESEEIANSKPSGEVNGATGGEGVVYGDEEEIPETWPGGLVGGREVLETIARKESKAQVHSLAEEIVDYEWPISMERLARRIAAGFGVRHLHARMNGKIERQIRNSEVTIDDDGYVWPPDVDPDGWRGVRRPDGERDFLEISPREIANVMRRFQAESPQIDASALEARTLQAYERTRFTKGVRRQFDLAWAHL